MRNIKKLIALVLALCMALSLMGVAYAAEDDPGTAGPPVAAPTEAEREEAELLAQALAESAKYLKLSVTELNLKAGETYEVRIVPLKLAQMFGWTINEEDSKSSNAQYLSLQGVDQKTMTLKFKAEKSGQRVSLNVKLSNPQLDEIVESFPTLAKYEKAAQQSLNKNMTCKVATVNTETKVVAGVGVTTTAVMPVVRPSGNGNGVVVLPPSSGSDPVTPPPVSGDDPVTPPGSGDDDPPAPSGHTHDWSANDGTCAGAGTCSGCPAAAGHADVLINAKCETCGAAGTKVTPEVCLQKDGHAKLLKGASCPGGCGTIGTLEPVDANVSVAPTTDEGTTTATVSDASAVTTAINAAKDERADGEDTPLNVVFDVASGSSDPAAQADTTNVTLSKDVVDALVAAADDGEGKTETIVVTVKSDTGTVQLPLSAIEQAAGKAAEDGDGDVTLAVKSVDAASIEGVEVADGKTTLTVEGTGEKVDLTDAVIVDVTLEIDGVDAEVSGLTEKIQITVVAPTDAEKVDVYYVKNGVLSVVQTNVAVSNGEVTFETSHLTEFVMKETEEGTVEPVVTPETCGQKDGHANLAKGTPCPGGCGYVGEKEDQPDPPVSTCENESGHEALHEGVQCAKCDYVGKVAHDYAADTDKCTCGAVKPGHQHVDAGGDGVCDKCGADVTAEPGPEPAAHEHDWTAKDGTCANASDGKCDGCPDKAGHANILTTAKCDTCGAAGTKTEQPDPSVTEDKCKDGHTWDDGTCSVCNTVCNHDGATTGTCSICEKVLGSTTNPPEPAKECTSDKSLDGKHSYKDGKCEYCEADQSGYEAPECDHDNLQPGEKCTVCNEYTAPATKPDSEPTLENHTHTFDENGECTFSGCTETGTPSGGGTGGET